MSKNNIDKILNSIDEDNIFKSSSNKSQNYQNVNKTKNINFVKSDINNQNTNIDKNEKNNQEHSRDFQQPKTFIKNTEQDFFGNIEYDGEIEIKKHVHSIINEINKKTIIQTMSKDKKSFYKTFNIKVIGVGGAGNNIVKYMKTSQVWPEFVQIMALNTDFVALSNMGDLNDIFILGAKELDGNGSGGDPNVGRMAAELDAEIIKEMLAGTDMLILVAGLGKGTGTGATPVIAKIAQDLGILTIGLFNLPSIGAEGNKIYSNALSGLQKLSYLCNGLTTVNNDKIISLDRERTSIKKAYQGANKYIKEIIVEIINIIVKPSDINIDFADVKNFFEDKNGFLFLKIELNDYSKDSIKEALENAIKTGFSEIEIHDSQKALLNFKLNENVPSVILENARTALKEIINTNNINIVHGISYNDNFEGAEINILLIGSFELGSIDDDDFIDYSSPSNGQKILATSSIDIDDLDEDLDDEIKNENDIYNTSKTSIEEMYNKFLNDKSLNNFNNEKMVENKLNDYNIDDIKSKDNYVSKSQDDSKNLKIKKKFLSMFRKKDSMDDEY